MKLFFVPQPVHRRSSRRISEYGELLINHYFFCLCRNYQFQMYPV